MAKIFISYKRFDKDKVYKIRDIIEAGTGVSCWIDLDGIESDAQFMNVIINAINSCETLLFMYSKEHQKITDFEKDWTARELNFAMKKGKRIVFINIDGTALSDFFEFNYGTKQQVDARNNQSMAKLISDIKKWHGIKEKPGTAVPPIPPTPPTSPKPKGKSRKENVGITAKFDKIVSRVYDKIIPKRIKDKTLSKIIIYSTLSSFILIVGVRYFIKDSGNDGSTFVKSDNVDESIATNNICFEVGDVNFEMVPIEGGTFTMGATTEQGSDVKDYEKPTHQVTLSDFAIGRTEVTQGLWEAVMGSNPSETSFGFGDDYPVNNVDWYDCQEFIEKLNELTGANFRLPTEAEWEYVARGGNKSQGYKYSGSNDINSVAWYCDNSNQMSHPVATKSPNELGIYDMSGNVWEWCNDWYGEYSSDSLTNPTGATSGSHRVVRGGAYNIAAINCRVSVRADNWPGDSVNTLGFRLAADNSI